MTLREEIRNSILSNPKFKRVKFEFFGTEVEIKQPSLREISEIGSGGDSNENVAVNLLLRYCYVPGTNEKVFDDKTDRAAVLELPFGEWFEDFNRKWASLTGINLGEAEKN